MDFPCTDPASLVEALQKHSGLIGLIEDAAAVPADQFQARYRAPMTAVAGFVLQIPASSEHHREPGGALRYAVQSAFFALRLADGAIFGASLASEVRRVVEPQYRYAAFLAALCSGLHLPHAYLTICDQDGEAWHEFSSPPGLAAWLSARGAGRYRLGWKEQPAVASRQVAVLLAHSILTEGVLGAVSPEVARALVSAIAPDPVPMGQEAILSKVVRQALAKSVELDRKAHGVAYAPPRAPVPGAEAIAAAALALSPPPTAPAAPLVQPPAAPADEPRGSTEPAVTLPKPESGRSRREPAVSTGPDTHRSPHPPLAAPPAAGGEAGGGAPSGDAVLQALDPAIREMFQCVAEDVRRGGPAAKRVRWERDGLAVSVGLLGDYGLSGAAVAQLLAKVGLVRRRDKSAVVLDEKLGRVILPREVGVA